MTRVPRRYRRPPCVSNVRTNLVPTPMTGGGGRKGGMVGVAARAYSRHPDSMSGGTRTVAMVVYPDVQIVDAAGPLEVFARTSRWLIDQGRRREPAYTVELLAARRGPVRCSSGLEIVVRRSFHEVGSGVGRLIFA